VLFVPDLPLGNVMVGPLADEINTPKNAVTAKKDNVFTMKYSTEDPVNEITKGAINAFPSWPSIDDCYRLNTELYAADGLDD
jgi:hypothetical protein